MSLVEFLYNLKLAYQETPTRGGTYHLVWIAVVVLACAIICALCVNCKDRTFRIIITAFWIWMLTFEVYKQVFFPAEMVNGEIVFRFNWSSFPFQLCSMPLYVLPLLGLLPEGKLRDAAAAFTMTYAFIGGVAVFIHPMTVFSSSVIANIHSMSHHGIQILTGVLTAVHYRKRLTKCFYFCGLGLFTALYTIAMLLNTVFRDYLIRAGKITPNTVFNMFFVSPYMSVHSPLPASLIEKIDRWAIVFIYYAALAVASALIILFARLLFCKKGDLDGEVDVACEQ